MTSIGSKLKVIRKQRKLSLRDVAAKAEVSASLLSQIETGKVNPSVMSLYNIAAALGVPVSELVPLAEVPTHTAAPIKHTNGNGMAHYTPAPQIVLPVAPSSSATAMRDAVLQNSDVRDAAFGDVASEDGCAITRKADRPTINLMHGVTWARLTCQPEQGIEFLELNYNPGASSGPAMSHHNGREWGLVVTGELLLELGFDMHILRPGDSIVFDSNTPHRLNNRGSEAMKAIWVVFDKNVER
jgi:DNA-binding XRE family transcriptional regulator/mannose-6-phosphate isomerase-like protein (cupin superfamily)